MHARPHSGHRPHSDHRPHSAHRPHSDHRSRPDRFGEGRSRSDDGRSRFGGRHELGQNFLHHRPTIERIVDLARATEGPILEIGPGDGALTTGLARLGRRLTLVELDEHRVGGLRQRFPRTTVVHADALHTDFDAPVVVGNLPFHLTTPLLRKLLRSSDWERAILVTQWEVARKRAGVGGGTLLTGQSAPWFDFQLRGRVPARAFRPVPGADGGLLDISRRCSPLVPPSERAAYERFVRRVFTARGRGIGQILQRGLGLTRSASTAALRRAALSPAALPRDLAPQQWASLWRSTGSGRG
ncbi:23S ribosomal RNA methyltransferase Erm [Leucobacter sp. CSA1]|uniref:23S ribosomal RNA methyltransferase Erm n=1 Tax=Leucobacter chromiisoli TaxID=2796471 RepID=A0A934UT04_9MICO|nr:23S ribosomal RNA methyltransferase Erm [Leucobacter chromiisoli]MBK0417859.1 23S ribosomal RNA methyltransferase Erm [Leucobacter chromiisoli]